MQKLIVTALIIAAAGCAPEEPVEGEPLPPPPAAAAAPGEDASDAQEAPEAAPARLSAAGEVTWPEDASLPATARLRVRLIDTSKADASAETLAEATYPVTGGPRVTFTLTTEKAVDAAAQLAVRAEISDDAALLFTSDSDTPVSAVEGEDYLVVSLKAVDPAP